MVSISLKQEELRKQIDALPMSPRLQSLREKYFGEAPKVCAERLKYTLQAWKETDGEPIEVRSAKKLNKILEGMPLLIHEGELTAGGQTRFFRGSAPHIDWDGEYFAKAVQQAVEGRRVAFGSPGIIGSIPEEDWRICEEASAYFKGRTPAEAARKVANDLWGDWHENAMEVRTLSPRYEELAFLPGVPLWEKLLNKGLGGMIQDAEGAMARFRESNENDPEKIYFWQAVVIACRAVIDFARRYARLARDMASREKDATRRAELEEIAQACDWVPENPPRTFLEAVQSIRLAHVAMLMENGRKGADLGRLDQLLHPYFKRDMEEGRLSLEKAADILGDFITYMARLEQIADLFLRETNQATMINHITLGGVMRDGRDGCNEMTYLMLHLLGQLAYAEPHATLRFHEGIPSWILAKALETNKKVNGVPMYLNDKHIVDYMHARGVPVEEARDYGVVGCSQPVASPQRHYTNMQMNTVVPLDLALHNGVSPISGKKIGCETGDPRNFKSFDDLYDAYKKQYEFLFGRIFRLRRLMYLAEVDLFRMPFRSAVDFASVENGKSHLLGGCGMYPLSHAKDRCMVDVADSLTAARKLVFDEKKLTMAQLIDALDANFAGESGEEIRRWCLAAPKYGNDIDEADFMVRDVGKFSANFIFSQKNVFGYPYSINRNGLAFHYATGKGVGATPNGRPSRAPFADGSLSPMNGMDKSGPTAVLNSALKADYKESLVAILNQKFPLTVVQNPEIMQKIAAIAATFMRNGGLHIQYNFVDRKILLDAKKRPEKYRDLVVRVAGYSAYFVNLTPEVQDEIISRTEQSF
ncbi:MAG: hypothetical protein HYX92_02130 [Chloroflexi bacterium]|nr:hypothetical protein [Chloroflexota bacterium]